MNGASGTHGCLNKGVTMTLPVKGEETPAESLGRLKTANSEGK